MQISPETKKISEIFPIEGSLSYRIPIYQRNYSWLDHQIESLIDDIKQETSGYYIGNVLITRNEETNILEIVDGQQRLTTISLLFLAIFELSTKFSESYSKYVGALQSDIKRKLLVDESIDTPRYTLLNTDNASYREIIKTLLVEEKPYLGKKKKFSQRYQRIKEILIKDFENFNMLKNFYDKLNAVELLKITVTKLSDAFSIFSSLNSKGLPLTLVDLLKNEYLKQATKENINSSNALASWEELMDVFSESKEINVNDVTQFLTNNYDAFESNERRSITKGEALDLYIKLINKGSNYIDQLKDRSHWFDFIKDSDAKVTVDSEVKKLVYNLTFLDPTQSFPLLFLLFVKQNELQLTKEHFVQLLNNIISFFVRRNITLKPKASNVRSIFINLNRDILEKRLKAETIVQLVKAVLIKESVSDQILTQTLIEEGVYDKSSSLTRFLLVDIERKLETKNKLEGKSAFFTKANPDTLDEFIPSPNGKNPKLRWTIEHILPEGTKLPNHWEVMISPTDLSKARVLQEENVHKIGNLTLTPYNSELGQKNFVEKRDKKDSSNFVGLRLQLALNETIPNRQINENIDTKMSWTVEDINRRTQELAQLILSFYKL